MDRTLPAVSSPDGVKTPVRHKRKDLRWVPLRWRRKVLPELTKEQAELLMTIKFPCC